MIIPCIYIYILCVNIYIYIWKKKNVPDRLPVNDLKFPPLQSEEGSSVVQAKEVDHRNPWHSQDVLVPVMEMTWKLSIDIT